MKKITLVLMMVVLVFTVGCQSEVMSKFDGVKDKGILVLGTSADYPPYEFHKEIDGADTIVGFDIEIAKAIALDMGVELEIVDMKFEGLLPALEAGKIDLIVAGMTPTDERKKNVDFSNIYYDSKQTILIKKADGSTMTTMASFTDKTIGVQKGTIQEGLAFEKFVDSKVQSIGKIPDLILALKTGKVDAVILAETVALSYSNSNDDIILNGMDLGSEGGSAIAVSKGSGNYLESINTIINKLIEEGKIDEFITEATILSGD